MNAIRTLRCFWRDECGAEMVEWAVVTLVLLSLTIIAIINIRDELLLMYEATFTAIQEDPPDTYDNP